MRIRFLLLTMIFMMLLTFASCGQQGASDGGGTMKNTETTEEVLPEYPDSQETQKETESTPDPETEKKQERDTEFSGLDVQESTEIILDEGQDVVVY